MARREYLKNEKKYDSVTTVLGIIDAPWLKYWYGKHGIAECNRVVKEAGAKGSAVHKAIEYHLKFGKVPAMGDKNVRTCFDHYLHFRKEHDVKPVLAEHTLFDDAILVAGTLDTGVLLDGVPTILDWKAGKHIPETSAYQLGALVKMSHRNPIPSGFMPTQRAVVHINELLENYELKIYDESSEFEALEPSWNGFLAALLLFRQRKANPNYTVPEDVQKVFGTLAEGASAINETSFELEL